MFQLQVGTDRRFLRPEDAVGSLGYCRLRGRRILPWLSEPGWPSHGLPDSPRKRWTLAALIACQGFGTAQSLGALGVFLRSGSAGPRDWYGP